MGESWIAAPEQALATGWERDTPSDDTLVRSFVDGWSDMSEAVALGLGGRVIRDDTLMAADGASPGAYANSAVLLAPLTESSAADTASRLTRFYAEGTGGSWMLFSATPTPDLRPYGLHLVGHPPLMFRPPGGEAPAPPPGIEIVEVTDDELLVTFERTCIEGYPMPELADAPPPCLLPDAVLTDPAFRMWIGVVDGEPSATSMAHVGDGMSHVEWVSAKEAVRGRGYGAAITWPSTLIRADVPSLLIASDDGRPVYDRMGYLPLTRFTVWMGSRSES